LTAVNGNEIRMISTHSAAAPDVLVLWDIDHTLVDTAQVSRDLYARAFRIATGIDLAQPWRFDGRTESAAVIEALADHGLRPDTVLIRRLFDAISTVHAQAAHRFTTHGRVLPGAREALASLSSLEHVHQSVLTGNLREVAATKLAAFDLGQALDLRIGAYGSDATDRTALVPHAYTRAADILGLAFTGRTTVVIGDTPRDIEVARSAGALGIGVATGHYSTTQLATAGADLVLTDLSDTTALLTTLAAHFGWSECGSSRCLGR
jgi:phosphoglycolate phosphatase-like HAD superfamily hydrolase